MPIVTELAVLGGEAGAEEAVEEVVSIDWNTVEISDRTYLVIAPVSEWKLCLVFL